jgi:hypothetical protein
MAAESLLLQCNKNDLSAFSWEMATGRDLTMDAKKPPRAKRRPPVLAAAESATETGRALAKQTENAAVDLAEEGAETIRRTAEQHGLQLHEAATVAGKAHRIIMADVKDGAATLAHSGHEVVAGLQDVGRVWAEFVQDGMRESIAATQSLMHARSFGEAMRIQGEYLRRSFELLIDTTAEISDLSKQMLSMTAHRLAEVSASRH